MMKMMYSLSTGIPPTGASALPAIGLRLLLCRRFISSVSCCCAASSCPAMLSCTALSSRLAL